MPIVVAGSTSTGLDCIRIVLLVRIYLTASCLISNVHWKGKNADPKLMKGLPYVTYLCLVALNQVDQVVLECTLDSRLNGYPLVI